MHFLKSVVICSQFKINGNTKHLAKLVLNFLNKLNYLKTTLLKCLVGKGFNCPNCNHSENSIISKKYLFTSLRRCKNCLLLYRAPTTTEEENNKFYQETYNQGFTTDCPDEEKLKQLIKTNFDGTEKSYKDYLNVLINLDDRKNLELLDFGCSWGYGSFQLKKQGYKVYSYEISKPRSNYAKTKLNIKIIDNLNSLENNQFDIFFCSHVLEHLPDLNSTINFALKVLKKDGFFVAFTPNGSKYCREKYKDWNKWWGMVHPNFLDENFYKNRFKNYKYYITSSPYDGNSIKKFMNGDNIYCDELSGGELLIIVKNK